MKIYKLLASITTLLTLPNALLISNENIDKHFSIFIASYNNQELARTNIQSALSQNYSNYHIYYVNDCSTDLTEEYILAEVALQYK